MLELNLALAQQKLKFLQNFYHFSEEFFAPKIPPKLTFFEVEIKFIRSDPVEFRQPLFREIPKILDSVDMIFSARKFIFSNRNKIFPSRFSDSKNGNSFWKTPRPRFPRTLFAPKKLSSISTSPENLDSLIISRNFFSEIRERTKYLFSACLKG